jgi:opacity protein-like surface antigen
LPSSVYTPHQVLGNSVTQLIPAMAFLQLTPWPQAHLSPYAGIGAGYEWLRSSANDYDTGYSFHAGYSNWAWQTFAGMGIRLSRELRLDGEAFYNAGQLGRDIHDSNGILGREVVNVDGAGIRCGLNVAY